MSKKTLYICGDSFCSSDPEYGESWTDMLAAQLPHINVVNLAKSGASNYLIYQQVKHALNSQCDYLIYNASGSTRHEFVLDPITTITGPDHHARYLNIIESDSQAELLSMSWVVPFEASGNNKDRFSNEQLEEIKKFCLRYVDMSSTIEKNYIFISYTLGLIANSQSPVKWAWSRGGFEHPSFKPIKDWDFDAYTDQESSINLWDYYDAKIRRPHFHVTDKAICQKTCDEYIKLLQL